MIKKIFVLLALCMAPFHASAIFTSAEIDYVLAGYPDGAIAFIPKGDNRHNPGNCTKTQAYFMENNHDTKAALSILLAAKMANKRVYFSVVDTCHTPDQTDASGSYPVIQRVGIR